MYRVFGCTGSAADDIVSLPSLSTLTL
jgi:hypothetical protein